MKKPVHRDYTNATYPHSYNEGLDEMEAYYQSRTCIWYKRWKVLRKDLRDCGAGALFPVQVTNVMTKITREIK